MAVSTSYQQGWSPIPADPVYTHNSSTARPKSAIQKSPILKDPVDTSRSEFEAYDAPRPRVTGNALHIARTHQGHELALLFNPAFRVIPLGVRSVKQETVDHGKENYRRIKEIQRANREKNKKESSRQEPVKAVYKPSKYDHIQSKVTERLATPTAPRKEFAELSITRSKSDQPVDVPASANSSTPAGAAVKSPADCGRPSSAPVARPSQTSDRPGSTEVKRPSTAGVDLQSSYGDRRHSVNHINENRRRVRSVTLKRSPSLSALDDLQKKKQAELAEYKRGTVPKYLQSRKAQWKKEEEERIANAPDPTIPAGHSLMPEQERLQTLDMLRKSQKEMMSELQALPLSRDTIRVKQRRDLLEKKLQEVETALKIFSRQRVFVKDD